MFERNESMWSLSHILAKQFLTTAMMGKDSKVTNDKHHVGVTNSTQENCQIEST